MFSGIPLPNMNELSIPAKLAQLNELQKQHLENEYYPQNAMAKNASQLAYANLMGPQFLAKLIGNPAILSNTPEDQKSALLQKLYAAAGQKGNNPFNQEGSQPASLSGFLTNKLKGLFDNDEKPVGQNPFSSANLSQQDQNAISGMKPGDSYVIKGNQNNNDDDQSFHDPLDLIPTPNSSSKPTFAENQGKYQGVVEEGKKSGQIRAQDIKDLNDIVFNGQTTQTTLDNLSNILGSKEFEQIRQIPLAGQHELSYYAKFGTPEQQNMIGQYYTLTGNIIKDSARDFAGQFRKGEQQLLSGMKPSPSDTVDVARGKTESLSVMQKMLTERAKLTSEIMSKYHSNKLEAQELADKHINGNQIRSQIHNRLNPKPTDSDIDFMAKKYSISADEVRNRLKKKGLL